ncbi:MAG: hypothetical protein ILP19_03565, partial [Oscillospiraceae bacterium]|nr:hypothetical protein [Oscillospiraceae bacterium]
MERKKNINRLISWVLSVLMAMSTLPAGNVFADDEPAPADVAYSDVTDGDTPADSDITDGDVSADIQVDNNTDDHADNNADGTEELSGSEDTFVPDSEASAEEETADEIPADEDTADTPYDIELFDSEEVELYAGTPDSAIIDAGMGAITKWVPGGHMISSGLKPLFYKLFKVNGADPTQESIKQMRKEINERLDNIEEEIKQSRSDVLNEFKNTVYTNGLGKSLDTFYTSSENLLTQIETNNNSTKLTANEKAVENAFLIGNNATWGNSGIVFELKNISRVLTGQSLADSSGRDIYQVIYESNTLNSMFSGEAYDASENYIDKMMLVYFTGCTVVALCMADAQRVSELTPEEVEALSPLVRAHYDACAVAEGQHITDEMEFIADNVFDTKNPRSVISHYTAFQWKKMFMRNLFVDKGRCNPPIPVSDKYGITTFSFKEYKTRRRQRKDSGVDKYITDTVIPTVRNTANSSALSPKQTLDLANHYFSLHPGGDFCKYLYSMCGISADEVYFPIAYSGNDAVHEYRDHLKYDHDKWKIYYDYVGKSGKYTAMPYELTAKETFSSSPCKTVSYGTTMTLFRRADLPTVPSTAEEALSQIDEVRNKQLENDETNYVITLSLKEPGRVYTPGNRYYGLFDVFDVKITTKGTGQAVDINSVELLWEGIIRYTEPSADFRQIVLGDDNTISFHYWDYYRVRVKVINPNGTLACSDYVTVNAMDLPQYMTVG